jgi:hypothetical protein
MKLVAIAHAPAHPDEAARALAAASGLTLAEARMRLAPEPPALLARLPSDDAAVLVTALRRAGLAALALDVRVPSDQDRLLAHTASLDPGGATFSPRFGDPMVVAYPDVLAILRGVRATRLDVERTEKSRRPSLGAAVITGGLWVTRTTTSKVRSSNETLQQVILVYGRDGRAVTLADGELDFTFLGARMQPSSTANMVEIARLLRERATGAFYDERLTRLGRRPLPFLAAGESRTQTPTVTTTHTDTSSSLDVLAEVMRQALLASLLP